MSALSTLSPTTLAQLAACAVLLAMVGAVYVAHLVERWKDRSTDALIKRGMRALYGRKT